MNKDKKITHIKVLGDGLKGMEITYSHPEVKDNATWANETTDTKKYPVHSSLQKHIDELRTFLLDICGYYGESINKSDKDRLISETVISEVKILPDGFQIVGEIRVSIGKFVKLKTPNVDSTDNYEYHSTVAHIINSIIIETHEYMQGKVKMSEKEYLTKYAAMKGDEVLLKEMKDMSAKEIQDACQKILEKTGAVILINEDIDLSDMDLSSELDFDKKTPEPIIAIGEVPENLKEKEVVSIPKF